VRQESGEWPTARSEKLDDLISKVRGAKSVSQPSAVELTRKTYTGFTQPFYTRILHKKPCRKVFYGKALQIGATGD